MTSQILRPAATRRRYVPDLNLLLDRCEHNYFTLKALSARAVDAGPSDRGLVLTVLEKDRYTTTLQLEEMRTASHFADKGPQFIVRLYHDVKLAEVLQWHNRRILKGSYPYPNAAMLQRDEKQRVNEFLAEWLMTVETRRMAVFQKTMNMIVDHSQWKSLP